LRKRLEEQAALEKAKRREADEAAKLRRLKRFGGGT
jgi:hypothetical protein